MTQIIQIDVRHAKCRALLIPNTKSNVVIPMKVEIVCFELVETVLELTMYFRYSGAMMNKSKALAAM